jgi:hypothetical protein
MSIIDTLNPWKTVWWKKDKWAQVGSEIAVFTKETHDCPSWDVGVVKLKHYRHKDTCENRWRETENFTMFDKTVFNDPKDGGVTILGNTCNHISEYDIYDGPKYKTSTQQK